MTGYRDASVDVDAIGEDIRRIAAIESPTSHAAGVNAVLDVIAKWFEGASVTLERFKIRDDFGDLLKVRTGVRHGVRPRGSETNSRGGRRQVPSPRLRGEG